MSSVSRQDSNLGYLVRSTNATPVLYVLPVILKLMFLLLAFLKQEEMGFGLFYVSCPSDWFLLSCGTENTQTAKYDQMRYTLAIDSQTCECYAFYGMKCSAWCTDKTLLDQVHQLNLVRENAAESSCAIGSKLTGCSLKPLLLLGFSRYTKTSTSPFIHGCTCTDNEGAWCVASCVSNIKNNELIMKTGTGKVLISCTKPENNILGCGVNANGTLSGDWPHSHVLNQTTCEYFGQSELQFYATCGLIFDPKSSI